MYENLSGKHFITLEDWTKEEIDILLSVSADLKNRFKNREITEYVKNQTAFLMFFEQSTRTRNSMEAGITQLGGHAHFLDTSTMQISHGEVAKDTAIILWDLSSSKNIYKKTAHKAQINAIRFSPDGKYYASGSSDKTVKIWQQSNQRLIHTLKKHSRGVRDIAFARKRKIIASAADDKKIIIWDYTTGKQKQIMTGHDFIISSIHFSVDGSALVSASRDKTIRLWNVKKGRFIRTLSGENEQITSSAITPTGSLLAVGTLDKDISLLRLPKKLFRKRIKKKPSPVTTSQQIEDRDLDEEDSVFKEKVKTSVISDQDIETRHHNRPHNRKNKNSRLYQLFYLPLWPIRSDPV